MEEPNFLQQKIIEYPRVAGVIFLLVSCDLLYTGVMEPYNNISNQTLEVRISFWSILLGITFFVLGLIFLLFGNKFANELFLSPSDLPAKQKFLLYAVSVLIGGGLFFLVIKFLGNHGYSLF